MFECLNKINTLPYSLFPIPYSLFPLNSKLSKPSKPSFKHSNILTFQHSNIRTFKLYMFTYLTYMNKPTPAPSIHCHSSLRYAAGVGCV